MIRVRETLRGAGRIISDGHDRVLGRRDGQLRFRHFRARHLVQVPARVVLVLERDLRGQQTNLGN